MLTQDDINKLKAELTAEVGPDGKNQRINKMAVIRGLFDEIEQKQKSGWRHHDIALWLKGKGIVLSLNQLNRYLSDVRRERRLREHPSGDFVLHNPKTQVQQGVAALPKPAAPAAAKVEKREEKPAVKPAVPAPAAAVAARVVPSSDSDSGDDVWNVKKPVTDAKGFVRQPHDK